MRIERTVDDFLRSGNDVFGDIRGQQAQIVVGLGSRLLDVAHGCDERAREAQAADREIFYGTLGLRAPQRFTRHLHLAERIFFDSVVAHRLLTFSVAWSAGLRYDSAVFARAWRADRSRSEQCPRVGSSMRRSASKSLRNPWRRCPA